MEGILNDTREKSAHEKSREGFGGVLAEFEARLGEGVPEHMVFHGREFPLTCPSDIAVAEAQHLASTAAALHQELTERNDYYGEKAAGTVESLTAAYEKFVLEVAALERDQPEVAKQLATYIPVLAYAVAHAEELWNERNSK